MSRPRCDECRFFEAQNKGHGFCQRYAPRAVLIGEIKQFEFNSDVEAHETIWPCVEGDARCGEWESADEHQAKAYKRYERVSADGQSIETFDGNGSFLGHRPNPQFKQASILMTGGMCHYKD